MVECYCMPELVNNDFKSSLARSWGLTDYGMSILNSPAFYDCAGSSFDSVWNPTNMGMSTLSSLSPVGCYPSGTYGQNCGNDVYSAMCDPTLQPLSKEIHDSLSAVPVLNDNKSVQEIFNKLKDNPAKLAALELTYGQMYGSPCKLRQDLRHCCGGVQGLLGIGKAGCEQIDALNEAAKISPMNASIALKEATSGFNAFGLGCDNNTVDQIITGSNNCQLAQIAICYSQMTGSSLQEDIRKIGHLGTGLNNDLAQKVNLALAGI